MLLFKEDDFHKTIKDYLELKIRGENDFWTYLPFGEKRNAITGSLLKAKGTKRGVPDFMILKRKKDITSIIWLEAKVGKNKQSKEQIDFENKTKNMKNEKYFVFYPQDNWEKILDYYLK